MTPRITFDFENGPVVPERELPEKVSLMSEFNDHIRFHVDGSQEGTEYVVFLVRKVYVCSCKSAQYRGTCKHITLIKQYMEGTDS